MCDMLLINWYGGKTPSASLPKRIMKNKGGLYIGAATGGGGGGGDKFLNC